MVAGDFQSLLDSAEALDGDDRLDVMLQASGLPVETCALADVEVGNLHIPFSGGVFARDEAGEGGFTDPAFLRNQRDDNCCHPPGITKARKNARKNSWFNEMP